MSIEERIKDHTANVLAVEASSAMRPVMNEALRSLGLQNGQVVPSIQDAMSLLETQPIDWLIAPLSTSEEPTILQILRMTQENKDLAHLRISVLLTEEQLDILPKVFEWGAMSFHLKPNTKDVLLAEFQSLGEIMKECEYDSTLIAAEYLRKYLALRSGWNDLRLLSTSLMGMYPGRSELLLHAAESSFHCGQKQFAMKMLSQLHLIGGKYAERVNHFVGKYLNDEEKAAFKAAAPSTENGSGNVLDLESIVVIDPDDLVRKSIITALTDSGIKNIQDFAEGEAAWKWLEANPEPNLIITEWKVPKVSTPALIQRVRGKGFHNCLVIIVSSLIKKTDLPIISEMSVANVVEKPINKEHFLQALMWSLTQDKSPTDEKSVELKIQQLIRTKKLPQAKAYLKKIIESKKNELSYRLLVLKAEIAFEEHNYDLARQLGLEALKLKRDSVQALNILGKTCMQMHDFPTALKCFQKAQDISPSNIERFCMMAEAEAEMGEPEKAQETLDAASQLDPDSQALLEGKAKVAIVSDSETAKKLLENLASVSQIIAYNNNKAVAFARSGFPEEGLNLYQKTVESVPDKQKELKAVLMYNMALAKIRASKLAESRQDILKVIQLGNTKVHRKAMSLKKKIDDAMAKGQQVSLADHAPVPEPAPAPAGADGKQAVPAIAVPVELKGLEELEVGKRCLIGIFRASSAPPGPLGQIKSDPVKFKPRGEFNRKAS